MRWIAVWYKALGRAMAGLRGSESVDRWCRLSLGEGLERGIARVRRRRGLLWKWSSGALEGGQGSKWL